MNKLILAILFATSSWFAVAHAEFQDESVSSDEAQIQRGPPRGPPRRPPPRQPRPPGNPRPPGAPGGPRQPSTMYIGQFSTGNPLGWDRDTVSVNAYGYWYGAIFELRQGSDVELGSITVVCSNGDICFDQGLRGRVQRGRPLYVNFPYGLDVQSISVESKPTGISIPSAKVNVYLYQ